MREIKFRGWHKEYKEMLSHYALWEDFGFDCFNNNFIDITQYTGLKDKNGVEIYEGDIVSIGNYKSVIEWSNDKTGYWQLETYSENQIEVIGNIYEHPHLLKEDT